MKLPVLSLFLLFSLSLVPNTFGQSKIVGGTDVPPGQYPWMVALAHKAGSPLFNRQYGAGSLIAPSWVLTAAHCVEEESIATIEIFANLTNLNDGDIEGAGVERRNVKGIYIYPFFKDVDGNLFNDIALILLDAPIDSVTPVAFAQAFNAVTAGVSVRAIGWGATQADPYFPTTLKMTDLSIDTIAAANKAYGISSLDNRHLAASASGKDTCSGDSGGPLFKTDGAPGAEPLLVGITSYGLGCARDGIPGIYANVGNYAAWINAFLAQPTTGEADLTVTGYGLEIPNGSRATSTLNGTNFGKRLRAGRSKSRQFTISNAPGAIPLSVRWMQTSGKPFSVQSAPPYVFGGGSGILSVKYRAPRRRRNGTTKSTLTFRTNDQVNPYCSFSLAGKYRKNRKRR